jgi:hypothetical protein
VREKDSTYLNLHNSTSVLIKNKVITRCHIEDLICYSIRVVTKKHGEEKREQVMQRFVPEVVSIADACLGGLQGRSALLIGPEEQRQPYRLLLQQAGMKCIYQEETACYVSTILPHVQLVMSLPAPSDSGSCALHRTPLLPVSVIAQGCVGRRTPLLIFDLAESPSIEESAGLLPAVCLYTPEDLQNILLRNQVQNS